MTFICAKCQLAMKCLKTGQLVELMMADGPYKVLAADTYGCECGHTVIVQSSQPIAEHYQPEYKQWATQKGIVRYWSTKRERDQFKAAEEVAK